MVCYECVASLRDRRLVSYNVNSCPLQVLVLLFQSFTATAHRFELHAQYTVLLLERLDAHAQLDRLRAAAAAVGLDGRRARRAAAAVRRQRHVHRRTARVALHVAAERRVRHRRDDTSPAASSRVVFSRRSRRTLRRLISQKPPLPSPTDPSKKPTA